VLGAVIGQLVAGAPGLAGGLLGGALTAVFMLFTAGSIVIAQRATRTEPNVTLFFGIILGAWMLKFVLFIAIVVLLRGADFVDPVVFFFAILAAVIGSLVVDVVAFLRSRTPYVDVALPGDE
jgi:hypothetical protein